MTREMTTLTLTVDLDCHLCDKKIKKVIRKLEDRELIQNTAYDKEKKTVTISGPFDPIKMKEKLRCKACRVIKDMKIKEKEKPEKNKPPEPVKKPEPVCCGPCHVSCHDSCRCCSCRCMVGWHPYLTAVGKPVTYQFSCDCEEVPYPCSIM